MRKVIQNMVGGSRQSDMPLLSGALTVNMDVEKIDSDGPEAAVLRSIPGLSSWIDVQGVPRGRLVASRGPNGRPRLFVVFGSTLYCVDRLFGEDTLVEVGRVNGRTGPVYMCETGGSTPKLCVADGTSVHVCDTTAASGEIADTYRNINLPKGPDGNYIRPQRITYQFGYLTVNGAGSDYIYRSIQYPFETKDSSGHDVWDVFTMDDGLKQEAPNGMYIPADWVPDNITSMVSTGGVLFAMGPRSFQRFLATNDSTMPFNSPNTSSMNIGILAPDSLAAAGADVFFLGSSDIGQFGIYRANGSECVRISTPEMERVIAKFGNPEDAIGFCYTRSTHVYYVITFREDDRTFCYDAAYGVWSDRASITGADNVRHAWRYSMAFLYDGSVMFLTNGGIVKEDFGKWTEHDGRPMLRMRRGGATVNGMTQFFVDNVVFMLSNGYGNEARPEVNPRIMFRYSMDGTTFSNERLGHMGRQGEYGYVTTFPRLGVGRVLNMELSVTEDMDFAILGCVVNATGCGRGF